LAFARADLHGICKSIDAFKLVHYLVVLSDSCLNRVQNLGLLQSVPSGKIPTHNICIPAEESVISYALLHSLTNTCRCTALRTEHQFNSQEKVKRPVKGYPFSRLREYTAYIKVKQSRNRPGVAQRVPGGLGSQIFMTFGR